MPTTQAIGILFNATGIAAGGLSPPFKTKLQAKNSALVVYDVLELDVTLQETHSAQTEVTMHPVEIGSDVTDHIRPKPVEVKIDGLITGSPLARDAVLTMLAASPLGPGLAIGEAAALAVLGKAQFVKDAFNTLRRIRDQGQLVIINTPFQVYEDMAMTDLSVARDQHTGDSLRFNASFRQIVTVEGATTVTMPALAQAASDTGTQSTTTAPEAVRKSNKTQLEQLLGNAANSIGLIQPSRLPFGLPGQ